nr:retrotransposon protein, putative, Ty1-copia subclass [Tanacetum cinerariifolium]
MKDHSFSPNSKIELLLFNSNYCIDSVKKGLPKIRGTLLSSYISKITKSAGKVNLPTSTSIFSSIPTGLNASYRGWNHGRGNQCKNEYNGRSARTWLFLLVTWNFLGYFLETMVKDFDNIAFGIMTMAVSEHFLHTKPSIDSEEFVNVFVRIGFGSTIKLVSFNESQVVTFNGKFVCGFRNGDCNIGSQSDNTVGILHGFVIHDIEVFKANEKVTKVIDVENRRIDNSRMLRRIVSLIEQNFFVLSTKFFIQSVVDWKSSKQSTTAMLAIEAEYIAASEAGMEAVWIRKFISGLVDVVFDGAFGGVGDEEVVVGERLDEEALVEFMVEWCEEDEDDDRNKEGDLFN